MSGRASLVGLGHGGGLGQVVVARGAARTPRRRPRLQALAHPRAEESGAAREQDPLAPTCSDTGLRVPAATLESVDLELLDSTLADLGEPRLPRPPGVGVDGARRRLLRGDDQPPGGAARARWRSGCRSPLSRSSARPTRATAPRRRCSSPPTGARSRRCSCATATAAAPCACRASPAARSPAPSAPPGRWRFGRNLTASEILDQALHFRRADPATGDGGELNHAVFMGMGEPLLNLDAVLGGLRAAAGRSASTPPRTTISTVGWVPGHRRAGRARGAHDPACPLAARARRRAALRADAGERPLPAGRRARGLPALARAAPAARCSWST